MSNTRLSTIHAARRMLVVVTSLLWLHGIGVSQGDSLTQADSLEVVTGLTTDEGKPHQEKWPREFWERDWLQHPPAAGKMNSDSLFRFLVWYDSVLARRTVAERNWMKHQFSVQIESTQAVAGRSKSPVPQRDNRPFFLLLGALLLTILNVCMNPAIVRIAGRLVSRRRPEIPPSSDDGAGPIDKEKDRGDVDMESRDKDVFPSAPPMKRAAGQMIGIDGILSPIVDLHQQLAPVMERTRRASHEQLSDPSWRRDVSLKTLVMFRECFQRVSDEFEQRFGWHLDDRKAVSEPESRPELHRRFMPKPSRVEFATIIDYGRAARQSQTDQEAWINSLNATRVTAYRPDGELSAGSSGQRVALRREPGGMYFLVQEKGQFLLFPDFLIQRDALNGLSQCFRYPLPPQTTGGFYRVNVLKNCAVCLSSGEGWMLKDKGDLEVVPAQS